jgi:hypothetical protein
MEPISQALILRQSRSIPAETVGFANLTFLVGCSGSGNFEDPADWLEEGA